MGLRVRGKMAPALGVFFYGVCYEDTSNRRKNIQNKIKKHLKHWFSLGKLFLLYIENKKSTTYIAYLNTYVVLVKFSPHTTPTKKRSIVRQEQ